MRAREITILPSYRLPIYLPIVSQSPPNPLPIASRLRRVLERRPLPNGTRALMPRRTATPWPPLCPPERPRAERPVRCNARECAEARPGEILTGWHTPWPLRFPSRPHLTSIPILPSSRSDPHLALISLQFPSRPHLRDLQDLREPSPITPPPLLLPWQFPVGIVDVNGQQLDTRRSNSWLLKLHEISTPEAAEVAIPSSPSLGLPSSPSLGLP